jgi:hypothetical protein
MLFGYTTIPTGLRCRKSRCSARRHGATCQVNDGRDGPVG